MQKSIDNQEKKFFDRYGGDTDLAALKKSFEMFANFPALSGPYHTDPNLPDRPIFDSFEQLEPKEFQLMKSDPNVENFLRINVEGWMGDPADLIGTRMYGGVLNKSGTLDLSALDLVPTHPQGYFALAQRLKKIEKFKEKFFEIL